MKAKNGADVEDLIDTSVHEHLARDDSFRSAVMAHSRDHELVWFMLGTEAYDAYESRIGAASRFTTFDREQPNIFATWRGYVSPFSCYRDASQDPWCVALCWETTTDPRS